jgi:Lhr-like helicase
VRHSAVIRKQMEFPQNINIVCPERLAPEFRRLVDRTMAHIKARNIALLKEHSQYEKLDKRANKSFQQLEEFYNQHQPRFIEEFDRSRHIGGDCYKLIAWWKFQLDHPPIRH